jgi:hypothetical protein
MALHRTEHKTDVFAELKRSQQDRERAKRALEAADAAYSAASTRLHEYFKNQKPPLNKEERKARAEQAAQRQRERAEYCVTGLPVGVVARFRAMPFFDQPTGHAASELHAGPRGGLRLVGGIRSGYLPAHLPALVEKLTQELDYIEWMHPLLEELLRPYISRRRRPIDPFGMFGDTSAVDPAARRRRLRELHPDKLGREQTPAEREEFTELSARR